MRVFEFVVVHVWGVSGTVPLMKIMSQKVLKFAKQENAERYSENYVCMVLK